MNPDESSNIGAPPIPGAESSSNVLGTEPAVSSANPLGGLGGNPNVVSAVTADVNNPGSQATGQEFTTPFTDPNQGATPAEASYPTTPIPTSELLKGLEDTPASPAAENTGVHSDQSPAVETATEQGKTPEDILKQKVSDAMQGVSDAVVKFVEETTREKIAA